MPSGRTPQDKKKLASTTLKGFETPGPCVVSHRDAKHKTQHMIKLMTNHMIDSIRERPESDLVHPALCMDMRGLALVYK